jgi:hypothetical protein
MSNGLDGAHSTMSDMAGGRFGGRVFDIVDVGDGRSGGAPGPWSALRNLGQGTDIIGR